MHGMPVTGGRGFSSLQSWWYNGIPPYVATRSHEHTRSHIQYRIGGDMDYFDLGTFSRPITMQSPDAQIWFDRGLNWVYGYNHMEAVACFRKALAHDATCAMAHWGMAYALGPNYNLPWHLLDPTGRAQALALAYDAMQHALALADGASAVEQALIRALPARYP